MSGYETLIVESSTTEEDREKIRQKDRKYCEEYVRAHSGEHSRHELEMMWAILTSRGEEKLMYGPYPFGGTV